MKPSPALCECGHTEDEHDICDCPHCPAGVHDCHANASCECQDYQPLTRPKKRRWK